METTRTTSMPGAAYVVCKGHGLPHIEKGADPQHFALLFDGDVEELLSEYWGGASVPARDFYRALQDIRFAVNRVKNGGAR